MLDGALENILFLFSLIDYVCNEVLELPIGLGIVASIFVVLVVFVHVLVGLTDDGMQPLWDFVIFSTSGEFQSLLPKVEDRGFLSLSMLRWCIRTLTLCHTLYFYRSRSWKGAERGGVSAES